MTDRLRCKTFTGSSLLNYGTTDFGTGYSSLSYLQKLPVDVLKIDRSFITPLDESTERGELVAAIIHIAHTMRKRIVAEGVETVEQLNKLKEFGCDLVQGYFIARPLPAVELEQFLNQNQADLSQS